MRKIHLAIRAAAVVAFPGGFGTLAELFEVLTLVLTRKEPSIPLVCVDRSYWSQVVNFDVLLDAGVISPADLAYCVSPTMRKALGESSSRRASAPRISAKRRACPIPSFERARASCLSMIFSGNRCTLFGIML